MKYENHICDLTYIYINKKWVGAEQPLSRSKCTLTLSLIGKQ